MRIASDQFVNGNRPTGALIQASCTEIRTIDGACWVQLDLDGAEPPTEGSIVLEEGAEPRKVSLVANPSGMWSTLPLPADAQISARPGYPRLIIKAPVAKPKK